MLVYCLAIIRLFEISVARWYWQVSRNQTGAIACFQFFDLT